MRFLTTRHLSGELAIAAAAVRAAYDDFQKVNAEVLVLSRQNTNIRSLGISLGRKREIVAQCQERLHVVEAAVRTDDAKATR